MSAPLAYQASAPSNHVLTVASLPPEVATCLDNARFLHLATCDQQVPHVSLMNYTYLPETPFHKSPTIVMTTNPASKKTLNLQANPRVSLLVHDWVSHRPPITSRPSTDIVTQDPSVALAGAAATAITGGSGGSSGAPAPQGQPRSSLADLLFKMNTSALSRISATINGEARFLEPGSEEEKWCKEMHLKNNTFGDDPQDSSSLLGSSPGSAAIAADAAGDGGRGRFIEDEAVQVVVVHIRDGRIADWKGSIQDWTLSIPEQRLPNGV